MTKDLDAKNLGFIPNWEGNDAIYKKNKKLKSYSGGYED